MYIKYTYTSICFILYILYAKNKYNYERFNNMIYDRLRLEIILCQTITYLSTQEILSIGLGLYLEYWSVLYARVSGYSYLFTQYYY